MYGPKKAIAKKDVKSKVVAKKGCDGRLIAKVLIMTIQGNLVLNPSETWRRQTNSAEFSLLKFLLLAIAYDHLAATLDFTSFFTMAFLGATHFFYSWAVFGLDSNFTRRKKKGDCMI